MSYRYRKPILIGVLVLLTSATSLAKPNQKAFLDGIAAYKSGRYQEAVTAFKALADQGLTNPKLFYNLGNAYLKNKDLGRAILWYQRAARLKGNDPDLKFNLAYAESLTKDADNARGPSLKKILFFWKYRLSNQTVLTLALILNGLWWCLLLIRMLIKTQRRPLGIAVLVAALPAVIFVFTAIYNYYEISHSSKAVILPKKVSVRSGFSDHATELFVLHAGTTVNIQKKQGDFLRISYSKDKIGWIKRSVAGVI
jgi:tetratricopeptide (TPR) repeat protein